MSAAGQGINNVEPDESLYLFNCNQVSPCLKLRKYSYCLIPVHNTDPRMDGPYVLLVTELYWWILSHNPVGLFSMNMILLSSWSLKEMGGGKAAAKLSYIYWSRLKPLYALFFYFEGPVLLGWCADSQQNKRHLPVPKVQWKHSGKILSCFSSIVALVRITVCSDSNHTRIAEVNVNWHVWYTSK